MNMPLPPISSHPEGEPKNIQKTPPTSWPLDTPGGRFHAELSDQAAATREGQLIFPVPPGKRAMAELREFTTLFIHHGRSFPNRFAKISFGCGFSDLENRWDACASFSEVFENRIPASAQLDFGSLPCWSLVETFDESSLARRQRSLRMQKAPARVGGRGLDWRTGRNAYITRSRRLRRRRRFPSARRWALAPRR